MLLDVPLPPLRAVQSPDPYWPHDARWFADLPRVRAALAAFPYEGGVTIRRCHAFAPRLGLSAIVCVPVRDEAALLPQTLAALGAALRAAPSAGAVFIINNSADASGDIVRDWAASAGVPVLCCECQFEHPAEGVAIARRLALDIAEAVGSADAALLSTDADTAVPPDWIVRITARLDGGAAFVVAGIEVDRDEEAALPIEVRRAGAVEAALGEAYQAIWERLVGPTSCPLLLAAGGANMAISARAYRAVGRLPIGRRNEDRALTEAVIAAGLPLAVERSITVRTSLRTDVRARNGMAETIAERCRDADPRVDDLLVPLRTFLLRVCAIAAGGRCVERGGMAAMRLSEAIEALADAKTLLTRLDLAPPARRLAVAKAHLHD
ncbi:glycosyltransferase [Acuticoccus sp. M5D2P5]|uniref:glycosyltransferase n=1 Tax=Acuticoccus kalidii TaxID=2910977 RepID=UPI001F3FCDBD|nr:glycosyltransferase [Acuticoccus kalidii]MCF3934553.1 glycosyltransferase [Acuticoccus kalidii]